MAAVARLVPVNSGLELPEPELEGRWATGDEGCGGVVAAIRELSVAEANELACNLVCRIPADCIDSCSLQGWNDTEWNVKSLTADHVRRPVLSQLVNAVQRITTAIVARRRCDDYEYIHFGADTSNRTALRAKVQVRLESFSTYWRDTAQLLSLGVTYISQLFIPLAFEHMGNHTTDQQLHEWVKNMKHLRNILDTKLSGWIHDVQAVSELIMNYKIPVEEKDQPGKYVFREPRLYNDVLDYHEQQLFLRDNFSALCENQQPQASQMFGLADALYSVYRSFRFNTLQALPYAITNTIGEEWQLEDKSSATLNVDTDCMQLLANALDHPTCPLEDLPPETIKQRQQCRVQLWDDMAQRWPHIPVTSYLAYTQRANVNLCLLAWMTVNSFSICQDVPFSITQSVHDARCYFDTPDNESCLESKVTDAICSVSRAILLQKCHDFYSSERVEDCSVGLVLETKDRYGSLKYTSYEEGRPTGTTLNYKDSLNRATLKYKNFKIDFLKPLEISFIAVNFFFRFLTAAVYVYLPVLRNLPGKIFLSFQITGIIQILCSEVVYRMTGVLDLPTIVLIDSSLTLLSCIWLNTFCYQMYACVRHLRLPNDLLPAEASEVFRRQVFYALMPWIIACTVCTAFEKSNNYYLIHSRIIFLVCISLSVAFNLLCLGLAGYLFIRTRNSLQQLKISTNNKFASKKQLVFMSVKAVILSGIGIIIRIGLHQAEGIAQLVYYVHIATMVQGPLLFVFFICNESTLPVLRNRLLAVWYPDIIVPGQELCSSAERNLANRINVQFPTAEISL
ncbi:uncharacterized protein LOC126284961 [Schistocerca gregaria]|uniref:uncharacterized protein LOC126284961 n=1 Tax=Schistocerca gregaria TaxID=7010 RepID=UPI00211F1834|nr:uncharacterized protein LOC126284961 [Schistocerca gregaria]